MTPFAKSVGDLAFSGLLLLFLAGCGQPPPTATDPPRRVGVGLWR